MRLAVLAHGSFSVEGAKTAMGLLRYGRDPVVAVVDEDQAGRDAGEVVGAPGEGVPVVASVEEALEHDPEVLAIGIAPVGGGLPEAWRGDLTAALENGLEVWSGLHTRIARDPELAALANERGRRIWDVREPTITERIATGEAWNVDAVVVLTVGTDCSSGKMTTTVELWQEARERGLNAAWVATGQTGLMLGADAGEPMDAIVSDFVAGAMEACVLEAAGEHDLVVVEGQGSLTHPAYGGVTQSILLGSFPDLLVLCDVPSRANYAFPGARDFPMNTPDWERDLLEAVLADHTGGFVAAASLGTWDLQEAQAREAIAMVEEELQIPAGDVVRGDRGKLLDGLLDALAHLPERKKDAASRLLDQAGRG